MKRQILSIATVLALTAAGAGFAQSTLNTTAPGPTQQQEPGQTNNNLPNPGNPVPTPDNQQPVQEQGTVSGTATESMTNNQGANTGSNLNQGTTTTTGTMQTEEGMDVDVDTGANAEGVMDVDVSRTSDADTDASGIDETGGMDNQSGTYSGDTDSLPQTAGELPTLALFGLLALFGAFMVRRIARA
ncbi:MAG TPA: hypothetical protein VLE27_11660 [Thermoanaerobaculia bacterium]|nr:hypothetical protein [Thermoanaerobaculia bacterium]